FRAQIHRWLSLSTEDAFLPLAALTDAAAVAGDPSLLAEVRDEFMRRVNGNDAFLARFARPVLSFDTPGTGPLASILHAIGDSSEGIDLKKAGLFPVVHGVRSLALERGVAATGTDERIGRLAGEGVFGDGFAADLREAFQFLLALQLKTALAAAGRGNGAATAPLVDRHALSRAEATLLKDSLRVVVALKEQVAHHFRLSLF
ncbi:MAG TPA: putative nucleotidyltransferase substrate binding domain-containing protein, partial [Stellaceae bacterium]